MDDERNESKQIIIRERRKTKQIGRILWIVTIIAGILGWIFWNWFAFPISIGLAFLIGSIYSYRVTKRVEIDTNLSIEEQEALLKNRFIQESKKNYGLRHKDIIMDKKIPITPFEVIRRIKDIPKILEWSRKKHLTVSGPEFWGIHHIYIDNFLKHVIFCLKADLTTHVFIGIPTGAKEWKKYDKNVRLLFSKQLSDDSLEWKIYKDIVLYKGKRLPPKEIPAEPYWGEVVGVETFNDDINDQWIVSKIKELYNK